MGRSRDGVALIEIIRPHAHAQQVMYQIAHGFHRIVDLAEQYPANPEDWPSGIISEGLAYNREKAEDSADVKYIDALGKFIAIATAERFTPAGYIIYRESLDGIHFSEPQKLKNRIQPGCHNAGISGTPEGHIDLKANNFISYAYQDENGAWGKWDTFLNPITIEVNGSIQR